MTKDEQQEFLAKQHILKKIWKLEEEMKCVFGNAKLKYRNKILALKRRLK